MIKTKLQFIKPWLGLMLFLCFGACHQVRIELDALPSNTPEGSAIYIAGNFNNWNPGDPDYRLQFDATSSKWFAEIPSGFGQLKYKFTRGDWSSVETDSCGGDLLDRMLSYQADSTLKPWISGWKDLAPIYCNKITIVLDSIPVNTPSISSIYLSGNINYWVLGDRAYRFTKGPDNKYYLTVPRMEDKLVFKLNRGTWESVEMDENNLDLGTREIIFGVKDTVHISMRNWFDLPIKKWVSKTIIIKKMPPIEVGSKIYISGSFNNWNPKDEAFTFKLNKEGKYYFTYTFSDIEAEYFKLTLGGWENREIKANGLEMNNRLLLKSGGDTLLVEVAKWAERTNFHSQNINNLNAALAKDISILNKSISEIINPINQEKGSFRKIIFILEKAPEMRNSQDKIYLTGDFNDWVTDMPGFEFKPLGNGKKYFVLRLNDQRAHEFKITRGDWEKEEGDRYRNRMNNKTIEAGSKDDTLKLNIASWIDYLPAKQITVVISQLPENTPPYQPLYLTGDFNGWQPADEHHRFKMVNGKPMLNITYFTENYNSFKVTRGDWEKEFCGEKGRILADQSFRKHLKNDTIFIQIKGWKDLVKP